MVDSASRPTRRRPSVEGGGPLTFGRGATEEKRRARTRAGYLAAITVNAILMVVANNLLGWSLLPFLTEDFVRVLWLINISLLATIAVNAGYLAYDRAWFKSLCQIGLGGISMAVVVRMYRVFPFDFSRFQFDWTWTARLVLVLAMVGVGIGIVAELVKLVRDLALISRTGPE
jgi:hypothetical protein